MKCSYQYRYNPIKECPHEVADDSPLCFFHEPVGGKDFEGMDLSEEDLEEAYLSEANLRGVNLSGSNLRYADLSDSDMSKANVSWCILEGADLSGSNLSGSNLSSSNLKNADLRTAKLINADLSLANLEGANLTGIDLRGAELYGANLGRANVFNADFRGAKLYGVNLSGVRNLRYAIFDKVVVEEILGDRLSREGKFYEAVEAYNRAIDVYLLLKKLFKEGGLYDLAGVYSIGEWRVRGKIQRIAHKAIKSEHIKAFMSLTSKYRRKWLAFIEGETRWLLNRFLYHTSAYGESPLRVFLSTVFVILLYSWLYWMLDAVKGAKSFLENLYFSVVTFTTVGYGDYVPKPGYHLLAVSEAFLGAFLMAFFVVVLSRKVIR